MHPFDDDLPTARQNARTTPALGDVVLNGVSRFAALLVLVVYGPVFLLAGLLVAMSPGPTCVSKAYQRSDGSIVYLYEFRTECWRTYRETEVGWLLRQTGIYCLPRLVHVLLGQISVGERLVRLGV
jgi:lipopolysaccharide/colanic/teichoic acid biosynthesis glycosyltransferase